MTGTAKMKLSNGFFYTLVGAMTMALVGMVPANAEAKDKLIMSMTHDGSGSDLFVGCQSSGLLKIMGPKIQVQLKKLAGKPSGDGILCTDDDIICIIESDVHMSGAQDVFVSRTVVRGDLKRGNLKIKHDTCDENPALCAIPSLDVRTTSTQLTCFEADPDFVTQTLSGGPLHACAGVALSAFPLPTSHVIAETGMMGTCDG